MTPTNPFIWTNMIYLSLLILPHGEIIAAAFPSAVSAYIRLLAYLVWHTFIMKNALCQLQQLTLNLLYTIV